MGKARDAFKRDGYKTLLAAKTYNANTDGTGVDVTTLGGKAKCVLTIGSKSGTTPTVDVKLQESDVIGSGYADISGAAFTQVGDALSEQEIGVQLTPRKKYVRATVTVGGTTPVYGIACVLFAANDHVAVA